MSCVLIMMHQIGGREGAEVGEFMQTIRVSPRITGFTTHANPQASLVLPTQGRVLISVARFPPKSSGPSNVGRGFGLTASGALSVSPSGNIHAFLRVFTGRIRSRSCYVYEVFAKQTCL